MPKTKSAKKTLKDFQDQYGKEEGKRIYYATANKQGRDPDTFKKESLKLLDDIVIEQNGQMITIAKDTMLETVGTGAIAMVPNALGDKKKKKSKKKEEASNSQASELNLDY